LETKWASLIPYAKVAELLKDVLPIADTLNQETVRSHLHAIANRIEQGLGEESIRLFEGSDQDWEEQPLPDGPMTVGIDVSRFEWCVAVPLPAHEPLKYTAFRREETNESSARCRDEDIPEAVVRYRRHRRERPPAGSLASLKTEDANGLPIFDQGRRSESAPCLKYSPASRPCDLCTFEE
jgi:hypothetical protein